ncbi:MAG: hypothetical protein H0X34_12285 [Chthoniobacterales bacterium]|nr:hypothetical protein [Chthoniobacterales bacterium]
MEALNRLSVPLPNKKARNSGIILCTIRLARALLEELRNLGSHYPKYSKSTLSVPQLAARPAMVAHFFPAAAARTKIKT